MISCAVAMRLALLLHVLALAVAASASAVIIDSGDGTGNTSAPTPGDCQVVLCSDPGWKNVGIRSNGLTGVYLGGRFVLTANHVGPGSIVLDGQTYVYVPGTAVQLDNGDSTWADLLMFQIYPEPPLPALTIRSLAPAPATPVIMIGHGLDRGAATTWNFIDGWQWGSGQSMRWGTNSISGTDLVEIPPTFTQSLYTIFDQAGADHETQAAVGDSGGATFALNGTSWELAGILFAIGSAFEDQPPGTALYGNFTFSSDLSVYRDQILAVMALPEPTGALGPGIALAALLARRRQRFTISSTRA